MKRYFKKLMTCALACSICLSAAVPAFAAEFEKFPVTVYVVDDQGETVGTQVIEVQSAKKANVLDALKAADTASTAFAFTWRNNALTSVADSAVITTTDAFETEEWVIALNGKAVNDDLSTVAVAKNDVIVVYWADATVGTKLAMYDDSAIAEGIVSFYYYDAEGNKQPLVGVDVEIAGVKNMLEVTATGSNGEATDWDVTFVTDEKGQIWIAPYYLDEVTGDEKGNVNFEITKLAKDFTDEFISELDGYTKVEETYFNTHIDNSIVGAVVVGQNITYKAGMYDVAGATGDMTMVYVLVAAAAVVTLGAVVVMKKKAVKAN